MKFLFQPNQSKLADFLRFPKFLYQKDVFVQTSNLNDFKDAVDASYIDEMEHYKNLLTPFAKEIELFYTKDFHELDFIDCFRHALPSTGFKTGVDYLQTLLTLDAGEIKTHILAALNDEGESETSAPTNDASIEDIRKYLETYDLDPMVKWNLMMIFMDPKKYMLRYVTLMTNLEPIFETIYQPYAKEVAAYGEQLVTYLNEHGEQGLETLTYSLINKRFLINETSHLFISALYAYSFIVTDSPVTNEVLWGLRVEQAFKRISEIKKDQFNERIQIFKNLGDKTKYDVLKYISQGITSTKILARLTGVSSATISYHINAFLTAKIITLDNSNKKFSYVLNYRLLDELWTELKKDLNYPSN
jgi:DNA-binding transcriptional ArsR family regulator